MELSDRARNVLRATVLEFIEQGQPVGSRTLMEKRFPDLSAATIRNVFAELEAAGLLYQPHTSAGRVPTERAFRLFIDGLMSVTPLTEPEQAEIRALDEVDPGEDLLRAGGRILSRLAGMASVVVTSSADRRVLSQLHFIPSREAQKLLAVMLFRDGSVETRFVDVEVMPTDSEMERVHNLLEKLVGGKSLQELRDELAQQLENVQGALDTRQREAAELGLRAAESLAGVEPVVRVEGEAKLLEQPEFRDADQLRQLVKALSERRGLISLLDKTLRASTVQVLVGREAGEVGEGALSFVVAPFSDGGQPVGTISVVGPTRMDYPRLVPLVTATARAISESHQRPGSRSTRRRRQRRKTDRTP